MKTESRIIYSTWIHSQRLLVFTSHGEIFTIHVDQSPTGSLATFRENIWSDSEKPFLAVYRANTDDYLLVRQSGTNWEVCVYSRVFKQLTTLFEVVGGLASDHNPSVDWDTSWSLCSNSDLAHQTISN